MIIFIITAISVAIIAIITIYRGFRFIVTAKVIEVETPLYNQRQRKLFEEILKFMQQNRRAGTTTLIQNAVTGKKAWILATDQDHAMTFDAPGAVSIQHLYWTKGKSPMPVLVDNYTFIKILEAGLAGMTPTSKTNIVITEDQEGYDNIIDLF